MKSGVALFVAAVILICLVMYSVFCYAPGRESRKEERTRCRCCGNTFPKHLKSCPNCLVYTDKPE